MTETIDRDPVGTTYLALNGDTYRLVRYEVPFALVDTDDEREVPVYHYWSADGGAAGGLTDLPDGCIRVVLPTPERPARGSLFLAPDGTVFRLRSYSPDMMAEPFTGEDTVPSYAVLLPSGMSTNAEALPGDARLIWAPDPRPQA